MYKAMLAVVAAFVVLTACSQVLDAMAPSVSGAGSGAGQRTAAGTTLDVMPGTVEALEKTADDMDGFVFNKGYVTEGLRYYPEDYQVYYYNDKARTLRESGAIPSLSFTEGWDFACQAGFTSEGLEDLVVTWSDTEGAENKKISFTINPAKSVLNSQWHTGESKYSATYFDGAVVTALQHPAMSAARQFFFIAPDKPDRAGVGYQVTTQNLTDSEILEALCWCLDPGADLDAVNRADGIQPEEWSASLTLEEALADETFGGYVPAYIPWGVGLELRYSGFEGAERDYSFLDGDNGWLQDELNIYFSSGNVELEISVTWRNVQGQNGFGGMVVEPEDLKLSLVEANTSHHKNKADTISLGVCSGDVVVQLNARGLSGLDVLAVLQSVKGVYEQPDLAVVSALNDEFARFNNPLREYWPSSFESLVEGQEGAVLLTLESDAFRWGGEYHVTAGTEAVVAACPGFQIPDTVELLLPGYDSLAQDMVKTGLRVICLVRQDEETKGSYDASIEKMFYITDDGLTVPMYSYQVHDDVVGYTVGSLARRIGSVLN